MAPLIRQTHLVTGFVAGRRQHQGAWHVYVKMEPGNGYIIPWRQADDLARIIRDQLDGEILLEQVLLVMPDRAYEIPNLPTTDGGPALARHLWGALVSKARECEEQERATSIAHDAAILDRAGAPFGLSNDPAIQAEARKIALHDRELRRALPIAGIRSAEVLGAPTIEVKPTIPEDKLS